MQGSTPLDYSSSPSDVNLTASGRDGVRRFSAAHLLIALSLLLVTMPFIDQLPQGKMIESGLLTLVYLFGVMAVGGRRRTLIIAILLMTPALIGRWIDHVHAEPGVRGFTAFAAIIFTTFLMLHLFRFILLAPRVNSEVVCAGISGYLILGILWAMIFLLIDKVDPDAFNIGSSPASASMDSFDAMCFSFGTLSTLGYGNITPVSRPARMLPTIEAVIGMFYVAILISRLVALYSGKEPAKPTN
jgi:voltage-gated potassium channel